VCLDFGEDCVLLAVLITGWVAAFVGSRVEGSMSGIHWLALPVAFILMRTTLHPAIAIFLHQYDDSLLGQHLNLSSRLHSQLDP
jgi:hypothetical protein